MQIDPELCFQCGARLNGDDIGMYRKAVDRNAEKCLCIDCLAARYKTTRQYFEEKIAFLKASGCSLFPDGGA